MRLSVPQISPVLFPQAKSSLKTEVDSRIQELELQIWNQTNLLPLLKRNYYFHRLMDLFILLAQSQKKVKNNNPVKTEDQIHPSQSQGDSPTSKLNLPNTFGIEELDEKQYYKELEILKSKQSKEILDFLSSFEDKESKIKKEIEDCQDEQERIRLTKEYSKLNGKIQIDLKKIMGNHKRELDEFTFHNHF